MNKYQEALDRLHRLALNKRELKDNEVIKMCIEDVKVLSELIDRATPKKPNNDYDTEFECPTCGYLHEEYDVTTNRFCNQCGQKIEWEEQVNGKIN